MSEPIDMDAHRKKRMPPPADTMNCDYCGEPPHDYPLACPRILSITYYNDGEGNVESIMVTLREPCTQSSP